MTIKTCPICSISLEPSVVKLRFKDGDDWAFSKSILHLLNHGCKIPEDFAADIFKKPLFPEIGKVYLFREVYLGTSITTISKEIIDRVEYLIHEFGDKKYPKTPIRNLEETIEEFLKDWTQQDLLRQSRLLGSTFSLMYGTAGKSTEDEVIKYLENKNE